MRIGIMTIFSLIFCTNVLGQKVTMTAFADKLNQFGICTGENFRLLSKSIEEERVKREIDFVRFCDKGKVIDLANYSDDPNEYIEKIHRHTAALLGELDFDSFQYEIQLDKVNSSKDYKTFNLLVNLSINGTTYTHESFISPDYLNKYNGFMKYFGKIDSQEFYEIFNKVLADENSEYRLHEVKSVINNAAYYNDFGIIALTKEQAKMLHSGGVYFSPSYEDFNSSVTSKTIEKAKTRYKELGLLSHLSEDQINVSFDKIRQNNNRIINHVLQGIPDLTWDFDTELGNLENPYEEILMGLGVISKGQLSFSHIKDGFDTSKKSFSVKHSCNGRDYEVTLKVYDDWIDGSFFEHLEKVLSDQGFSFKLYSLYTGGQDMSLIMLTEQQANSLRNENLALFPDQWAEVEEY